jgi:zinc/manganese transport system substrate-binding protein
MGDGLIDSRKDTSYLTALLGVPILGYVEPLPGIPPTAAHLQGLVRSLTGKKGVILYNTFQSGDGPGFLARNLGWKTRQLQLECDLDATGQRYLDHIDRWVAAIASAKP